IFELMGLVADNQRDVREAFRLERLHRWRRPLEPVIVAWDTKTEPLLLRLPRRLLSNVTRLKLHHESAETISISLDSDILQRETTVEGEIYATRQIELPPIPFGYHELVLETSNQVYRSLV